MNISVKTKHHVSFHVCEYSNTEGGMDYREFGESVSTIEEAIYTLSMAKMSDKCGEWVIVCDVHTEVSAAGN